MRCWMNKLSDEICVLGHDRGDDDDTGTRGNAFSDKRTEDVPGLCSVLWRRIMIA